MSVGHRCPEAAVSEATQTISFNLYENLVGGMAGMDIAVAVAVAVAVAEEVAVKLMRS